MILLSLWYLSLVFTHTIDILTLTATTSHLHVFPCLGGSEVLWCPSHPWRCLRHTLPPMVEISGVLGEYGYSLHLRVCTLRLPTGGRALHPPLCGRALCPYLVWACSLSIFAWACSPLRSPPGGRALRPSLHGRALLSVHLCMGVLSSPSTFGWACSICGVLHKDHQILGPDGLFTGGEWPLRLFQTTSLLTKGFRRSAPFMWAAGY